MKRFGRKIFSFFFLAAIVAFAVFSAIRNVAFSDKARYAFIFESLGDEKMVYETRFLRKIEGQSAERIFCDELVLGSLFHDAKRIFPLETKIESLFVRENVLYVDFSQEFVKNASAETDFSKIAAIFNKNIAANFPSIQKVCLFCQGKQIKFDI